MPIPDLPAPADPEVPVLAELDPLDPPADYAFEEELQGSTPRPRSAELSAGLHATRQRKAVSGLLIAAVICTTIGLLPFVQLCGLYLLPLAYITWIGIGLGALGILSFASHKLNKGPYRYVEEGLPLVARIRDLSLSPTAIVNGQPTTYRFFALILYRDPESGEPRLAKVSSNDVGAGSKGQLTTTYRVGDYATAVYLPGKLEKSLRLYGFLDLKPGLGLVRRDGHKPGGAIALVATLLGVAGFFGILFWNVYAFARYGPLQFDMSRLGWPFGVGAVVLGGPLLWSMVMGSRRARSGREARNAEAIARGEPVELTSRAKPGWLGDYGPLMSLVAVAGAILIGGLTVICWYLTANALLDRSAPKYRPIQVDGLVMVTHKFLFREYKIKYHFLDGDAKSRDAFSTPFEMIRLGGERAVAEVHPGRFGLPWVKAILPAGDVPGP